MKELEQAVLAVDLPEHGLKVHYLGTIVLVHGEDMGCEVEFCALTGATCLADKPACLRCKCDYRPDL